MLGDSCPSHRAKKLARHKGRLFNWADALRMQGNEAAHDVNVTISAQDARDLVEFAHALLEYVFTFSEKFEAFQARRKLARERDLLAGDVSEGKNE